MNRVINPESLVPPIGYAHAVESIGGRTIYLAGQVSFDPKGSLIFAGDIVSQFQQSLSNLQQTMKAAGGAMTDIVKLLIFVKNKNLYRDNLKPIGQIYREYFGKYFPAMTLVEVTSLFEDDALLEIEGIAVIHD